MNPVPRNPYRNGERWLRLLLVVVISVTIAGAVRLVQRWPRPAAIVVYPPPVIVESHLPLATPVLTQASASISIMISGAVQQPGLYSLPVGATIADAISLAGGLAEAADSSTLRGEEVLLDGAVLHVPVILTRIQPED